MAYDYLNQEVVATCLIQSSDIDSFYNPTALTHTGYAFDGFYYTNGVQDSTRRASWFIEGTSSYRGSGQPFPSSGLVILSRVALTILDVTTVTAGLVLWMQFLMDDSFMLTDNFNGGLQGFSPKGLSYADGILSVEYSTNPGSTAVTTAMVGTIDFSQDKAYVDVAI
jgi:hypothetical protein